MEDTACGAVNVHADFFSYGERKSLTEALDLTILAFFVGSRILLRFGHNAVFVHSNDPLIN